MLWAEFLGMMGEGLCSSQVWEPVAHVEKNSCRKRVFGVMI